MRVKTDEKRQAIIEAAIAVFGEEGYERANMDNIARRAGGSKATVYGYFPSKEELFAVAMKAAVESTVGQIEGFLDTEAKDLRRVLQRVAETYLEFALSDQALAVTRTAISQGTASGLGAALYAQGPERGIQVLSEFFEEQTKRGRLVESDPVTAALHFTGLIVAGQLEPMLFGAKPWRERGAAIVDAVDAFLRAYQAKRTERKKTRTPA